MEISSKEEAIQQLLYDVESLMQDLYQSGFDTVHDSTLEALKNRNSLEMRRHQTKKQEDSLINVYTEVNQYVRLCREKIECDKGVNYYMV